ncbi:MAG: DNA polymerase III subunit epsilon [Crocinitomicaceae bacterium]|nr:DNA polymerase III subunit epsilon [Crocinitomicaceae bacterium]|tara:strand:- start:3798 stop:4571 length:774 start_codon:yes stop_codon:yes gene_type:complete
MEIKISKPLLVLDIEATGDQINKDRIVEIGMIKTNPDGSEETYEKRVNPEIPIPLNISEIHGIYDLDVKDCPTFKELSIEIKNFIGDSDLCGFNSNKFDIPMLEEEFIRAGVQSEFETKKLVDVQNIFHKMEKRTLAAAYMFYCNKDMENAHSAMYDARVTLEVLKAQTLKYNDLENNVPYLSDFSKANKASLDYAGRIILNEDKEAVINFGKHKGKLVNFVFEKEPGYYSWILKGDFSQNTKLCFKNLWKEFKEKK